jgi:raffinose/stachyose/melibiose transport system substrate-binding protein
MRVNIYKLKNERKKLKLKKILTLLLAVITLLPMTLTSCGKKDEKVLYYLNFKPEVAEVYSRLAKDFKAETGVTLNVVTAAANSYETTLKSELAKSSAPVIFHVNGPVGYRAWASYCEDISDFEVTSHLIDTDSAIKQGDSVMALPFVTEGYGIIYNNAIMEKYFALNGRATDFSSMDDINSFDKLAVLVSDMTNHKEELGIDGVFASTSMQSGEEWRWQTHLFNLPLYYELKDKSLPPLSSGLESIDFTYSQNYKNIFDLYINNSVTDRKLIGSKSVSDSMAEFALGRCAMVQNGNWAWSQISKVTGNTVKESDIKMLPIYIGAVGEEEQGLCIGTENYLAINSKASAEQKKMADEFLTWLFTSETGKDYVTNELGFIVPFDSFESDEIPSDPLAREIYRYLSDENKKNIPWSFTVIPSLEFKNSLGSDLLGYAQGNVSWEKLEANTVSEWKAEAK